MRLEILPVVALLAVCVTAPLAAQGVDENALFGGTNNQIVDQGRLQDRSIETNNNRKQVNFSGTVRSRTSYALRESWLEGGPESANKLTQLFEGDFLIDVRLPSGIKSLVNLSLWQTPQGRVDADDPAVTNSYGWLLKEAFVDLAASGSVTFRIGKQVLQWGRSTFWNPVDLVNYEKKNFFDMDRSREGATGMRTHVAFGTGLNFYSFFDVGNAEAGRDIAGAGKVEFVVGATEIAFSGWTKRGYVPVYGAEISTKVFGIDVKSECSLSEGSNTPRYVGEGFLVSAEDRSGDPVARATLTLTKSFDWDLADRITVIAEGLYNGAGYADDVLASPGRKAAIIMNNAYTPNWLSRWYGALFVSIAQFPDSTMTMSVNSMANLVDGSMIVSAALDWAPVNDLTLTGTVYALVGPDGREYTQQGRGLVFDFMASIVF